MRTRTTVSGTGVERGDRALTPAAMRRANERMLLGILTRVGRASRADLAKASGLSQPTTGKIIGRLLRHGILREAVDRRTSPSFPAVSRRRGVGPGRPGRQLEFDARTPRFWAVELDVTHTAVAPLPFHPKCEEVWATRFPTRRSLEAWLKELKERLPGPRPKSLWGGLVSVPGIVDETAGRVLFSPNVHWTEGVPLRERLEQLWGMPVMLVQEIRALALGHLMTHPEQRDFLLVDVGEGVGGAVVLGGRLFRNPLPLHGEIGHTPVPGNIRRCGCGGAGCLETLLNRRGLLEAFAASTPPGRHDWPALVAEVRARGILPWLDAALAAAGSVLAGALNALGLRRLVLTGLLNKLGSAVPERLFKAVRQGALWARFGEVECLAAGRRRAAGLVAAGSALLPG